MTARDIGVVDADRRCSTATDGTRADGELVHGPRGGSADNPQLEVACRSCGVWWGGETHDSAVSQSATRERGQRRGLDRDPADCGETVSRLRQQMTQPGEQLADRSGPCGFDADVLADRTTGRH